MWISSYCIACIYQQNTKVKQLFSLLTYEYSHSPAMKQTIHIHGVDNLVEEINIIQNRQECHWLWNMIYNLFAVHVKLLKLKGNMSWENTEKNICMTTWNLLPIGVFSIVFCIANCSIFFSPAAWQSCGPNNNHWRLNLNLSIPRTK